MKPKVLPEIYIDIHESDSGLFEDMKERDIGQCTVRHMETGDVVIRHDNFEIGCEVKRKNDFENSLHSGRLHDQIFRLTQTYDFPILIVEGWEGNDYDLHRKALRTLNRRICVLSTDDQADTIDLFESFIKDINAKKFQYLRRKIVLIDDIDPQISFLASLPNISVTRARELLDLFGSPENAFTHINEWSEINGITEDRLFKLKAIWGKEMER
ncbi:MAG: ERCC4 domain-containing protein [Syntrophorhabdaceae bacterium]|nr:ERCC4 domain-containing protein [Syntrophorhabdaceae bacterium]